VTVSLGCVFAVLVSWCARVAGLFVCVCVCVCVRVCVHVRMRACVCACVCACVICTV